VRQNHADLLADITDNDRKVKGDLEDAINSVVEGFAKDFN
jgi:F-type H+-transporting ATPase subunit alpha